MTDINPALSKELQPDEKVLWSGRPTLKLFNRHDLYLIPFSLLWTGMFVSFWLSNPQKGPESSPLFFDLFFAAMGFYILIGRFIYKIYQKKHTHYALTNKRALIIYSPGSADSKVDAAILDNIGSISRSAGKNGVGTIQFGKSSYWATGYGNNGLDMFMWPRGTIAPSFYDIRDAEKVYDLAMKPR